MTMAELYVPSHEGRARGREVTNCDPKIAPVVDSSSLTVLPI